MEDQQEQFITHVGPITRFGPEVLEHDITSDHLQRRQIYLLTAIIESSLVTHFSIMGRVPEAGSKNVQFRSLSNDYFQLANGYSSKFSLILAEAINQ